MRLLKEGREIVLTWLMKIANECLSAKGLARSHYNAMASREGR